MLSTKTIVKIIFNTALGVILIAVWLQFVNIRDILSTLSKVNIITILPVVICLFLSSAIRAVRLKIFLSGVKKIAILDLIFLNGFATMLNFLIPIRGGEIAKGVYLNNQYGLPLAKSLVWIFLDRFIDFLVVLILASILFFIIPTSLNITFIIIIIIIFLAGIILTYYMIYKVNLARKIFKYLTNLLIVNSIKLYFERIYNFFLDSFSILKRKPAELLALVLFTVLAYAADAGIWYFTFFSLGASQEYLKMYLGQLLSALTYLIPSAPGYVGSAEASGLLIFSGVFGIEPNLASAMTVLFHVILAIFVISFGIISVYFLKIDLGSILRRIFRKEAAKS